MEPPNRTNWIWSFETRPADLFPTLRAVGHPTSLFQPHKDILMHTLSDQLLEASPVFLSSFLSHNQIDKVT